MVVTLGQQYDVGEKQTVILYTYINRHAGTLDKKQKQNRSNVVHHKKISSNILFQRLQRQNLFMVFKRVPRWW